MELTLNENVTRPVSFDVRCNAFAAAVKGRVVVGAGADGGGVEGVEFGGEGWKV